MFLGQFVPIVKNTADAKIYISFVEDIVTDNSLKGVSRR